MKVKKHSELPIKKEFNIIERIKEFLEKRKTNTFWKYAQSNAKKAREKTLKAWSKMSDSEKINFLMAYTSLVHRRELGIDQMEYHDSEFYRKKFAQPLIDDLWRNSNYNVQKQVSVNEDSPVPGRRYIININSYIVDRNWEFTDPKLQKEVLQDIINCPITDETLRWNANIDNGTSRCSLQSIHV